MADYPSQIIATRFPREDGLMVQIPVGNVIFGKYNAEEEAFYDRLNNKIIPSASVGTWCVYADETTGIAYHSVGIGENVKFIPFTQNGYNIEITTESQKGSDPHTLYFCS